MSTEPAHPTAQALRERAARTPGSILLETSRPPVGHLARSFLFEHPVATLEAHALSDLPALFAQIDAAHAQGLWVAGYVDYECGYHFEPTAVPTGFTAQTSPPLASFGIYRQPLQFTSPSSVQSPEGNAASWKPLPDLALELNQHSFALQVAAIHRLIEAGETYQANLTTRVHSTWPGTPAQLFAHIMAAQPVEFGALLTLPACHILSASPELFFHLQPSPQGRHITVRPMKGTAPRGATPTQDAQNAATLAADPKNRAENLMIVDLLRSDLGRIAEIGSVHVDSLFHVEQFPTVLQMSSTVSARLRPEIDFYALFRALFPSGSIIGAPKVRTMQLLRQLEQRDRGVYTGAIGYIAPHGEAVFSVAIRTLILQNGQFEMGVGAGITYDSDPASEYAECLLKASFLNRPQFSLIETMRCENGTCLLLNRHLDRLQASAATFQFPFHRDKLHARICTEIAAVPSSAPASNTTAWKLRLTLDSSGQAHFATPEPLSAPTAPHLCMLWPEPVSSSDFFLRHKTTHRALYNAASQAARASGCLDALFCNEHGHLTEGATHNVFLRHGTLWRTPPLTAGVLPGVYRAHLLATRPAIQQANLTMADLVSADEIQVTNAVHGPRSITLAPPQTAPEPRAIVRS
jgi:para-aminobenzoate synthetase/4-amino-4-deoxychorismate lyase